MAKKPQTVEQTVEQTVDQIVYTDCIDLSTCTKSRRVRHTCLPYESEARQLAVNSGRGFFVIRVSGGVNQRAVQSSTARLYVVGTTKKPGLNQLSDELGYAFTPHVTIVDDAHGRWVAGDVIVTAAKI